MTEAELKSAIVVRDELLREAHELLAVVLLHGAIGLDIRPTFPTSARLRAWNTTLREMKIIGENQQLKQEG